MNYELGEFREEGNVTARLYWQCVNDRCDLILVNTTDFDFETYEELLDNFRIATEGCKPDPETLVAFLAAWGSSVGHGASLEFSFSYYARLLRWSITEGKHIDSFNIDAARDLWKFLFGTPIPTFYQFSTVEKKYETNVLQWKEWYDGIRKHDIDSTNE